MKAFSELTSASQVNNGDLLAISQTSGSGYASKKTTVKDITDKSNLNLAEEYDSTSSYAVGNYCIYESVLYKCIGTTTGAFDSTKWTTVVVTNEMGSGGGGGTGGHTIIDENGNSMSARAGLQFVGGANVSDSPTNNRTIVDLASAGGIDGVFIDTDNVIQASTPITSSANVSYTATQDCIVEFTLIAAQNNSSWANIDGKNIWENYFSAGISQFTNIAHLKKGQVIIFHQTYTDGNGHYTVYGIQTGTTHSKFQPVIYSTEERVIGVWTDGKPLYQKTLIDTTALTGTSKVIDISSLNAEFVQVISCELFETTNNSFSPVTWFNGNNQYYAYINTITNSKITIGYSSEIAVNRGTGGYIMTIQYTKSTDTAGSGSWTPQGVPTHHYSMDEQIVGTWMGETLWEKTIRINNGGNLSTGDNQFAHNISNFGRIINAKGNVIRGTGSLAKSMVIPYASAENNSGWDIGIYEFNSTVGYVKVGSSYVGDYILNDCYVTLQYTKSS